MNNRAEPVIRTLGKAEETPFKVLNEQVSQDLLAVRLLLAQAQEVEADRLEIIKLCDRYLNFALEDLRKLRDSK
jgi:hypothetical protein